MQRLAEFKFSVPVFDRAPGARIVQSINREVPPGSVHRDASIRRRSGDLKSKFEKLSSCSGELRKEENNPGSSERMQLC